MTPPTACPNCGAPLPADAPRGLCPNCLLGAALSRSAGGSRSEGAQITVSFQPADSSPSAAPASLAALAETLGGLPSVLLRDTDAPEPMLRPDSPELPDPADRSARLQLFGEIARGGMGAVLRGRDADLGRELAVKVLLEKHRTNPDLIRRFVEEAQIGGQLQHPGVVPIYELGAFADRRPYFAMKLVKGQTLATLLAARPSPADALPRFLGIFEQVCQTVAYAHARGVIHRDLKPSNVMVGSFGEVQIMDWGLAKVLPRGGVADDATAGKQPEQETVIATARSGDSDADRSRAGSIMGTPAYMAPEQARGEIQSIGERADVFALGSILCEMLTGAPAFAGRNSDEIQRKAARGDTSDALDRLDACGADVELVALARDCLAAEPEDRPRHAGAVAERMTAYLAGVQEKLRASERERAVAEARAVEERRKRRWQLGLAATVAASLLLGGLGLAYFAAALNRQKGELARANDALDRQRLRAEDREQQAIDAVKRFRDAVANNPELKDNPELKSLRKTLLKEPLAFFRTLHDRLQADGDTRPESLARLAAASFELGALTAEIGDKRDALTAFREALAIFRRLAEAHPDVSDYQRSLARSHFSLAQLQRETGQLTESRESFEAARATFRRLAEAHADVSDDQRELAASHGNLGILLAETGHPAEARAEYEATRAILRRLAEAHPDVADYQRDLAATHVNLGKLLAETNALAEARAEYEAGLAVLQRVAEAHPDVTLYQSTLAGSHLNLGTLLFATGHPSEARASLEAARAILRRLTEAHPNVTLYQQSLAGCHGRFGALLSETGDPSEARAEYEAALAIQERLADADPADINHQYNLALSHLNLGHLLSQTGDKSEARAEYEAALTISRRLGEAHSDVIDYQYMLALNHNNFGLLLHDIGHPAEARASLEAAQAIRRKLADTYPDSPDFASDLGNTLDSLALLDLDAQEFAAAADRIRAAIALQRKALAANPRHPFYRRCLRNHYTHLLRAARALDDTGLATEAERGLAGLEASDPGLAELDARLAAVLNGEAPRDNAERLDLALRADQTKRYAAATRLWAEALATEPELAETRQPQHRYHAAYVAVLAAAGAGRDDPEPDDAAKAALRAQALGWLKSELAAWSKVLDSDDPKARAAVAPTLQHWQQDPDLASVRDEAELAKLSDAERAEWQALWDEVEAILKTANRP